MKIKTTEETLQDTFDKNSKRADSLKKTNTIVEQAMTTFAKQALDRVLEISKNEGGYFGRATKRIVEQVKKEL